MSHLSRIKTQIVEKEYLLRALEDLGYSWEEGSTEVRGFGSQRASVEIKATPKGLWGKVGLGQQIGFRKAGGTYEVVADWWASGSGPKKFLQQLSQRYAYQATRAKLEEQGFELTGEEVQKDGRIHLVLRRTA